MNKETYKNIGKVLKIADDIHLSYYEYKNRMKKDVVPSMLVGGDCLSAILSNPFNGLENLHKKLHPFLKFCNSIRTRGDSTDKERSRYGGYVKKFKKAYQDVFENNDVIKGCYVDSFGKCLIMMEYFS